LKGPDTKADCLQLILQKLHFKLESTPVSFQEKHAQKIFCDQVLGVLVDIISKGKWYENFLTPRS
jgi:hypothetical protein